LDAHSHFASSWILMHHHALTSTSREYEKPCIIYIVFCVDILLYLILQLLGPKFYSTRVFLNIIYPETFYFIQM
jgi:hypothetical protein